MEILETNIVENTEDTFVKLVIADNVDLEQADEHIVLNVRVAAGVTVSRLAAIQNAALQRARDVIGDQIQEKQDILGRVEH